MEWVAILQGIFPTQESNPHLLHWQADSYPLYHQEGPLTATLCSDFHICQDLTWALYSILSSMCVLAAQSCPTLCDPVDCSPPGSSVHGILQARILEWVAIPFSRGSS